MRRSCVLLGLTLAACTVGPDYRRPDVDVPQAWRSDDAGLPGATDTAWWDRFDDPALSDIVRTALANNKDVAIATANVERAAAQYGIVRSAQFPEVDAGASASRQRGNSSVAIAVGPVVSNFGINLSAAFELDLWGRLRRASESARARLMASREARSTVVLSLVAAVADGYIELRGLDRQLEIAHSTTASLREAARLQRVRFEEGAVPESDYQQAESQYRGAAARVPELEREIARQENFLSILMGRNPGPIARGRTIDTLAFPAVPAALPASLLDRRPDIREAEQDVVAANADIGVARAAYFPNVDLTALIGVGSSELTNLFIGPSRIWSIGAGVTQPIFNAGRIAAQVSEAEALQRVALQRYERSIINAFRDVDDALADRLRFAQVREEQSQTVAALRRYRDLAQLRYREGATIYLEVANAEQSLFTAELAFVATQSRLFQSYSSLYKAMGGGWTDEAERFAATSAPSRTAIPASGQ